MPRSDPSSASNNIPHQRWVFCLEIGIIVAIFFLSSPAPPPGVNEPHYLCRLRHAADPGYCPGDLFFESQDAHFTVVLALSWLTRHFSLATLAWAGRLLCWTALAWAWLRLSWTVVPRPLFAALGAAIVVTGIAECNFAGEWMVGGFEAKPVAYVFVLLALRAWVANHWNWAWTHLGIASAWHALVGGWSVVVLLALWALGWRREQPLRGMLPGLLVGGAIALVGVLPALSLNAGAPPEVRAEAAEIYVFERLPHHLAPLHKPPAWIAERAGRHAVIVTLLVALLAVRWTEVAATGGRLRHDPAGQLAHFAAGAIALALVGFSIEWILYHQPALAARLLRYYWFRLADVAVPIAVALLWVRLLADMLERRSKLAPAMLLAMLLATGYPLLQRFTDFVARPVAVADSRVVDVGDWLDACQWIKTSTPSDALFLTPRGNSSFKWHAERGEVVTLKDVPQDAANLVEWRRRLYDVFKPAGNRGLDWVASTGQLGTSRVRQLAERYGFDYVLTTRDYPLDLPAVYANDTYVVYQVK